MFPEIRLVNGRAIIVGSTAAGLRAALVTGAERLVGTLKICSVITETWRVRLGKKGRLVRPRPLAHPPRLHLGLLRLPLLARCLRELLRRLLGLLPSLFRKWTRSTTPTKLLFFERLWHCLRTATFRRVFSMRFGKLFLRIVHRRGKRRKFLGNKLVLNMKKKLEKEEQELRERKSALELAARRLVTEREQKVMDQATIVSDLKMQLVELRQNIANNPTPEVSEDEDIDATPLGVPVAPPPAVPPAVPPENTPLNPTGDDMDDDLLEEANPPATKRKGEFGVIQVPTNRQEFQQWTAGLDRESVREGLLHFQALHEQHEREEHARQAEVMERASASGTVADDENPSG